jgi:translation initiation factor IF-1
MPKGDALEMDGTVIDTMRNSQFTVRRDNGHELLAYTGGKRRRFTSEFCSATMCELK